MCGGVQEALQNDKYVKRRSGEKQMRRSEQICARVTADEMTAIKRMSKQHSMLLSEFIRQALTEKMANLQVNTTEVSPVSIQTQMTSMGRSN
jgi:hypothetical protein